MGGARLKSSPENFEGAAPREQDLQRMAWPQRLEARAPRAECGLVLGVANAHGENTAAAPQLDVAEAYVAHAGRVRSLLLRVGAAPSDVPDLVSETFLVAFERRATFDAQRPVVPWLFGIAINLHRSHRRRAWVRRWLEVAMRREPASSVGPELEDQFFAAEDADRVQRVLATMKERHRLLLVLREYEELSAAEIAGTLGIAEGSVHSGLHQARREFLRRYRQRAFLEESSRE